MAHLDSIPDGPHAQPIDRSEEDDGSFSPWLLLWTILIVKVATLGLIVVVGRSNGGALIAVTSIPWLFAAFALALGPLLFRARLRRARARRDELRRQEWMASSDSQSADAPPPIQRFT